MRFDIITLFPTMVRGPLDDSIMYRAQEAGLIKVAVHDLRDWTEGKHRVADDAPFGGGDGMVMKPEPLFRSIKKVKEPAPGSLVLLTTPQGKRLDHQMAVGLSKKPGLILVCGHYGGIDERVKDELVDIEVSIGDYVLSGGELASLVIIDAVSRQIKGVLGNESSAEDDSFPQRLEYPLYTRPAEWDGKKVPEILLSGHHENIRRWRKKESLRRTLKMRPDLLEKYIPDEEEKELLQEIKREE
jgi:tRNA (guanine37-N1)-methyltransferase